MAAFYSFYPPSSPPVGGATAANQVIEIGLLTSIDSHTPTLGQKTMANSSPVVIASDQSPVAVTFTSGTVTANQGTANTNANGWPVKITDGTNNASVTAAGHLAVNLSSGGGTAITTSGPAGALDVNVANSASIGIKGNGVNGLSVTANTLLVSGDDAGTQRNIAVTSAGAVIVSGSVTTGGLTDTQLRASPVPVSGTVTANAGSGTFAVSAAALPLPAGAATSANQSTEIASLASIDSKLTSPLAVTGPLTDTQLRATPVPVSGTVTANAGTGTFAISAAALPLPTGAATEATLSAFSNKTAAGFVHERFDETVLTYVGATTDISTIVYKLTGSTVATLTLTYDGSNRLIDVVKT